VAKTARKKFVFFVNKGQVVLRKRHFGISVASHDNGG